ncbi:MAG: HD domain-containing phosphohydrolase [Candidatus Izemoplasmatales bacterium]
MVKKLLFGSIFLSILSLAIIIIGMLGVYNHGISVFEQEVKENKERSLELFVYDINNELKILTKAHAYWSLAQEAVENNDFEWISVNLSEYLYEGDFDIDILFIAKENGSIMDSFGLDDYNFVNTAIYNLVIEDNTEEDSIIWIGDHAYFLSAMPLADDDGMNPEGIFVLGRELSGDLLAYLTAIIEPAELACFSLLKEQPTDTDKPNHVVLSVDSIDDDLIIHACLQYTFTEYIKNNMISYTILVVASMYLITVMFFIGTSLNTLKHHKALIDSINMIQLSNKKLPRVPKNKVKEFDSIGIKVNEILKRIEEGYQNLANKNIEIVQLLSKANEINDLYTKEHSDKVREICKAIGKKMGLEDIDELILSAQLHDVGKVFIPLDILNKKDPLTNEEFDIIQKHTLYGYSLLEGIPSFKKISEGILSHHERVDGNGYPYGIKGDQIPLFAKIIAVADVYDALTSNRPYRKAFSKEEALNIMKQESNKQFDSKVLKVFFSYIEETNE